MLSGALKDRFKDVVGATNPMIIKEEIIVYDTSNFSFFTTPTAIWY